MLELKNGPWDGPQWSRYSVAMFGCELECESSNLCAIAAPASVPLLFLSSNSKVSWRGARMNALVGIWDGSLVVNMICEGRGWKIFWELEVSHAKIAIHLAMFVWCFFGIADNVVLPIVMVEVTDGVFVVRVFGTAGWLAGCWLTWLSEKVGIHGISGLVLGMQMSAALMSEGGKSFAYKIVGSLVMAVKSTGLLLMSKKMAMMEQATTIV